MSTKAALKAAKSALDAGDYETAIKQAQSVLSSDSTNYFARLFLGRAFEKQGQLEDAAKSYHAAAKSKPDDNQAWFGLCSLYESEGPKKVDEYREAAVRLAQILADADDMHRSQTTVDKLVTFSKQYGTKSQYKKALEVLLPGSPVFESLEGRIPHPSHTLTRLTDITEEEESQTIKQEIAARRTRIGARLGQVTVDVKREVFGKSKLEELYQQIISWSNDDEVRRKYEERLLERAYDVLVSLPTEQKAAKLNQVLTLAEGMVIIHHPFQFAWDVVLDSRDLDDLGGLDVHILREYIAVFPEAGLSKILKAWLSSELSPFAVVKDDESEEGKIKKEMSPDERLLLMTEGLPGCEQSSFAPRLVSDYYIHLEEYESAAEAARTGLKIVAAESAKLGMSMQNTTDALNSVLATALVHHQAPRNHSEARKLFEGILERKPKWTPALIGLGLIFEENGEYEHAISLLSRALEADTNNVRVGSELAWCRALNGDYSMAREELEGYLPKMEVEDPRARELRAQVLYRSGICIWELEPSKLARKDRSGAYSRFLAAIKTNVNFAPAYTSLGHYYSTYAKDKKRARQCYQKAFELSPAETDAAENLARSFADQGDWDIVEVIAQRVIDTGRARPPPGSKRKGLSWPYSALGVVQMNKQEYQLAIVSFLAALRINPQDYQSYVGLGESYHNSGRYNSALRTFNYALDPHDGVEMKVVGETWFASYMLANVHRELGDFDEAITELQEVLKERPKEFGVSMSLLQTFVEQSWRCVDAGLFGQAIDSASQAITVASDIAKSHSNAFNMWKAVGDACLTFSWIQSGIENLPSQVDALLNIGGNTAYDLLSDIDQIDLTALGTPNTNGDASSSRLIKPIAAGILSYKRAISTASHDIHAQAVAWYNLGWAEHRAYISSTSKSGKRYVQAAVRCFKRAIELEAGNAEFWNALGVLTTTLNPKVAQHSFVRSLHLNELNAKVWTNLGTLYLLQNDHELAHQAFGRAQSTDPTYAHAWVGEGLIALLLGDLTEAANHFTHAFEISDSSSTIAKRHYALSTFDHMLARSSASNDLTALIHPVFALEQLQRQRPHDLPYRHLTALLFERVGNHIAAIEELVSLCAMAESEYESSESLVALARFAHAKADLARNHLAVHNFEAAAENAEVALDLSSDADNNGLAPDARTKLRLSAHLTAGLALYYLRRREDSIAMFKTALQESDNDADVVTSLVKVLWAHGGTDEKTVAREQLFECVEKHPEHVGAVALLGAIAALDDDIDTAAAVKDDLVSLRSTKDGLTPFDRAQIDTLLLALACLVTNDPAAADEASLAAAQTAIMLHPDACGPWGELERLCGGEEHDEGEQEAAASASRMALTMALKSVPPSGNSMEAATLARTFARVRTSADVQRSICLAPWESSGWEAMVDILPSR